MIIDCNSALAGLAASKTLKATKKSEVVMERSKELKFYHTEVTNKIINTPYYERICLLEKMLPNFSKLRLIHGTN